MKRKYVILISVLFLLLLVSIPAYTEYRLTRIAATEYRTDTISTLEMNNRNQLRALCKSAGYREIPVLITVEKPSFWADSREWRWHVAFEDEPDTSYVFYHFRGGGWCLVEVLTAGPEAPQKSFDGAETYEGTLEDLKDVPEFREELADVMDRNFDLP